MRFPLLKRRNQYTITLKKFPSIWREPLGLLTCSPTRNTSEYLELTRRKIQRGVNISTIPQIKFIEGSDSSEPDFFSTILYNIIIMLWAANAKSFSSPRNRSPLRATRYHRLCRNHVFRLGPFFRSIYINIYIYIFPPLRRIRILGIFATEIQNFIQLFIISSCMLCAADHPRLLKILEKSNGQGWKLYFFVYPFILKHRRILLEILVANTPRIRTGLLWEDTHETQIICTKPENPRG